MNRFIEVPVDKRESKYVTQERKFINANLITHYLYIDYTGSDEKMTYYLHIYTSPEDYYSFEFNSVEERDAWIGSHN